ncbi:MAG TPA: helix-turn-helix domain-containing protein [Aeromicrobium sp.]|nr:helix-turn-helix domain-containing protein [Aeromicrobium sp.]
MPTPTWDRLRPERRERILVAAEAEFGSHGFSRASLNTIAREAGVAKGSLFQYFEDKADFYAHLSGLAALRIRHEMESTIARLDFEHDFFGSLFEVFVAWDDYFASHPSDLAMTAAVNLESDPGARMAVRQAVNVHYLETMGPVLATGVESGQLRADADLQTFGAMLLLLLPHLALAPQTPGLDPVLRLEELDRAGRQHALRGLTTMLQRAFGS